LLGPRADHCRRGAKILASRPIAPPIADGRHEVAAWREWMIAHGLKRADKHVDAMADMAAAEDYESDGE
jgi:hypothetical protein